MSAQNHPNGTRSSPAGTVALITGAARGIGASIALRLAQDGFNLCVTDVPSMSTALSATADSIRKSTGRKVVESLGDVSKMQDVERSVQECVAELGRLDVAVANAGIAKVKPLLETTAEDFQKLNDVNIIGVFNTYQAAAKQMIKQGHGGRIIGAASVVAFRPFTMLSPYSATKWAVRGLTQAAAMEWARYGIRVTAYAPGIADTAMWDLIDEELGKIEGRPKGETIVSKTKEYVLLGRTSVPEDIGKLVSFLASEDSEYMTGQTVLVDGGIQFS